MPLFARAALAWLVNVRLLDAPTRPDLLPTRDLPDHNLTDLRHLGSDTHG